MKIGLTGDIGSGKSTVLACFEALGFKTLSADAIVHELLANDQQLICEISHRFGATVVDEASGVINRNILGGIVFGDDTARKALEAMIHPRVRETWEKFIETHPDRSVVVEIPLLFEKKLETQFDYCVSIYTRQPVKIERLLKRGMSEDAIRARLKTQLDQNSKANRSDFLILNNGSLDFLKKQVSACAKSIALSQ